MSYRITYTEDADGNSILRYHGDAQNLVDACAAEMRDNEAQRGRPLKNMRKIMSLDPVVLMDVARQQGITDYFNPDLFDLLKDRDYSRFRTVNDRRLWKQGSKRKSVFILGRK